jgi:hypothetical protein
MHKYAQRGEERRAEESRKSVICRGNYTPIVSFSGKTV